MTRSLNFLLENAVAEQLCQFKIARVNAAESHIYEGTFTLAKCFALYLFKKRYDNVSKRLIQKRNAQPVAIINHAKPLYSCVSTRINSSHNASNENGEIVPNKNLIT